MKNYCSHRFPRRLSHISQLAPLPKKWEYSSTTSMKDLAVIKVDLELSIWLLPHGRVKRWKVSLWGPCLNGIQSEACLKLPHVLRFCSCGLSHYPRIGRPGFFHFGKVMDKASNFLSGQATIAHCISASFQEQEGLIILTTYERRPRVIKWKVWIRRSSKSNTTRSPSKKMVSSNSNGISQSFE